MCFCEHGLTIDEINVFCPKNFVIAHVFCRATHKNCIVAIFIKETVKFEKVDLGEFCSEINCELS